jgi:hypothetical protein
MAVARENRVGLPHNLATGAAIMATKATTGKSERTNIGKKEQRQIDQVLTKAAQGDETKERVAEKRLVPRQKKLKGHYKS